jgi:anti-sigma B factor antagonist
VPSLVSTTTPEKGDDVTGPQACWVGELELNDVPGVTVRGEIDINSAEALEDAIQRAIITTTGAFVIDLTEVEFLDSSGLAVMMRARGLLGREDRALAVICPPGAAKRAFEVAGFTEMFVTYDSRDEAFSALVPVD